MTFEDLKKCPGEANERLESGRRRCTASEYVGACAIEDPDECPFVVKGAQAALSERQKMR